MLTDEDGNIAERRHFDTWGQPIKVEDGAGKVLQGCHVLKKVVIINYYFISQIFSLSYLLKVHLIRSF